MKQYIGRQCVVVFGSLNSGIQSTHGPFQDFEHARKWAEINGHDQPFNVRLLRPIDDDVQKFT